MQNTIEWLLIVIAYIFKLKLSKSIQIETISYCRMLLCSRFFGEKSYHGGGGGIAIQYRYACMNVSIITLTRIFHLTRTIQMTTSVFVRDILYYILCLQLFIARYSLRNLWKQSANDHQIFIFIIVSKRNFCVSELV